MSTTLRRICLVFALLMVLVASIGILPTAASADEVPPPEAPEPVVPDVPEPEVPEVPEPEVPDIPEVPDVEVPEVPDVEVPDVEVPAPVAPAADTDIQLVAPETNVEPPTPENPPAPPDVGSECEAQHFSLTGGGTWQANTSQEPHGSENVTWLGTVGEGLHYTSAGSSGNFDWFFFFPGCPPEDTGSLDVLKVVAGEGTPDEGTQFTVEVTCDSDGFDTTLTFDENGALLSGDVPITDIPDGTNCTVSETDDGGADDVEIDPNGGQVEIEGESTVTVTVTNTFEQDGCEPNCPVPTAFSFSDPTPPTCEDVGNFLQQEFPGVSIVVDPPFDGPGTYTVTATLDDPNAVWADIGGNEPRSRTITVQDALGFQSDDPNAPCFLKPPPPPPGPPGVCIVNVDGHQVTIVDPEPGDCAEVPFTPIRFAPTCQDDPTQAGCTGTLPRTGADDTFRLVGIALALLIFGSLTTAAGFKLKRENS